MATTKLEWTPARRRSFIVSVLRNGSRRWPPKYETLNKSKTVKKINKKTGRQAQHFLCATCQKDFPQKEVQVDHKEPVVDPAVGFVNWDTFIERLYCDESNLQVLCKTCHDIKSKGEREFSKENRQPSVRPTGEAKSKSKALLKQNKEPSSLKVNSRKKKQTT